MKEIESSSEQNLFEYEFLPSKLDKISYRMTKNDSRELVPPEKLNSLPHSAIGLLKVTYNYNTVSYRTGVLIGENIVLTAGHNLFDPRRNPNKPNEILGSPLSLEFFPGLSENKSKFGKSEGKRIFFPMGYPKDNDEDYGIIILNESIGLKTGFMEMKIFEEDDKNNRILYNCGYPLNRSSNGNKVFYQYECKGKVQDIDEERGVIVSGIKSSYGQSGAGMFLEKEGKFYVVGVHVASSFDDENFYATMINKKRYRQIQSWIEESKK